MSKLLKITAAVVAPAAALALTAAPASAQSRDRDDTARNALRSEEHTSELQSH